MEINILSKFLLRIAKNNNFYKFIFTDDVFKMSLYDINLTSLRELNKKKPFYYDFYKKVEEVFDISKYLSKTLLNKSIVIENIVEYDKLCSYLDANGFMWGSNKRCIKYTPFEKNRINSELYIKLYLEESRVYYGHSYSAYGVNDIILNENDFYGYYENYKKHLNDVFYKCLKQNYGIFKKNK